MLKSKLLKRTIGWLIFLGLAFVTIFLIITVSMPDAKKYGNSYSEINYNQFGQQITDTLDALVNTDVLENEYLKVSVNKEGIVTVLQKSTGKEFSTALPSPKTGYFNEDTNDMLSAVAIEYQSDNINTASMYSYNESVKRSQNRVSISDDGKTLQVEYILGEKSEDSLLPEAIRATVFEKFLNNLSDEDKEYLNRRYTRYSLSELTVYDNPDELLAKYPGLEKYDFYIATDMTNKRVRQKTIELLEKAGYTSKDLQDDREACGIETKEDVPIFHIAMRYTLEGDSLVLSVPTEELMYTSEFPLRNISLNKFFLSSADGEGSILVPSGSGAIIKYGNNRSTDLYEKSFYGNDATIKQVEMGQEMIEDTSLTMPIFAMSNQTDGVLSIIEKGAASATLCVKRDKNTAYAYTKFNILQGDNVYLRNAKASVALANDDINEDIVIRYCFLDNLSNESYNDIAKYYRNYLLDNDLLSKSDINKTPSTSIEYIGGAELETEVLGLYLTDKFTTFTSFEKMYEFTEEFSKSVSGNLNVKISGWNSRGLYSQIPGKISVSKELGGKNKLDNLLNKLQSIKVNTYLEVSNAYYYNDGLLDSFQKSSMAQFADNSTALLGQYDTVNGFILKNSVKTAIVSPKFYKDYTVKYSESGYKTLALGNFVNTLNSDYNAENFFDRSRTQDTVENCLKEYDTKKIGITGSNPNLYAIKYLSLIEDMPFDAGGNIMFDKSVPFKQLVLHGSVSYVTSPLNLKDDFTSKVLQAV
ncbi:MAG: hypothetical protein IIW72_06510, partial [Clostridia bacterium]|nr:hypothetical protein [Clostridia bacterium]